MGSDQSQEISGPQQQEFQEVNPKQQQQQQYQFNHQQQQYQHQYQYNNNSNQINNNDNTNNNVYVIDDCGEYEPIKNTPISSKMTNSNTINLNNNNNCHTNANNGKRRRNFDTSTTFSNNGNTINSQQMETENESYQNEKNYTCHDQQNNHNNSNSDKNPEALTYSAEIQIKKKVKNNDQKDISLKLYFSKDPNNVSLQLPEKWANQSGSLQSSIEMLGSVSLKNYEKSEILKKLVETSQSVNKIGMSVQERSIHESNAFKLEQVSQMLSNFPEKYVKICSISCNLVDENKKIYTILKLSASADIANLLQKKCKQMKDNKNNNDTNDQNSLKYNTNIKQKQIIQNNDYKQLYNSMMIDVQKKSGNSSMTNGLNSTGVTSTSNCKNKNQNAYANGFIGECEDEEEEEENGAQNSNNQQQLKQQQQKEYEQFVKKQQIEQEQFMNQYSNKNAMCDDFAKSENLLKSNNSIQQYTYNNYQQQLQNQKLSNN